MSERTHTVLGLKVAGGKVDVKDLHEWLSSRDAAAGEHLADALRAYLEEPSDIDD
jgi:hypothetical protein